MLVLGIVGGVACGKSLVADLFRQQGAVVLNGDALGHEVLHEPEVKAEIRRHWGDAVFSAAGEINRQAVAKLVFDPTPGGREKLAWLEQLTHPRIGDRIKRQIEQLRAAKAVRVAVLDAPVMFKAGWDRNCNYLVFVDAPREVRLARALARGWSEADFARREAAQEPLETKRSRAHVIIDNAGLPAQTRAAVIRFWESLYGERP